jgi:hypothetical protein
MHPSNTPIPPVPSSISEALELSASQRRHGSHSIAFVAPAHQHVASPISAASAGYQPVEFVADQHAIADTHVQAHAYQQSIDRHEGLSIAREVGDERVATGRDQRQLSASFEDSVSVAAPDIAKVRSNPELLAAYESLVALHRKRILSDAHYRDAVRKLFDRFNAQDDSFMYHAFSEQRPAKTTSSSGPIAMPTSTSARLSSPPPMAQVSAPYLGNMYSDAVHQSFQAYTTSSVAKSIEREVAPGSANARGAARSRSRSMAADRRQDAAVFSASGSSSPYRRRGSLFYSQEAEPDDSKPRASEAASYTVPKSATPTTTMLHMLLLESGGTACTL